MSVNPIVNLVLDKSVGPNIGPVSHCPVTGKVCLKTRADAKRYARFKAWEYVRREHYRDYRCRFCGDLHLTSKPMMPPKAGAYFMEVL